MPGLWAGCDEASVSGYVKFMSGPSAARAQAKASTPTQGIARCTGQLDDPAVAAGPWQRRASLLRDRALHHVADKDPAAALADLDAIRAIEQPDASYARSFAASLDLLRALALAQSGRMREAADAAVTASARRPWSSRLQELAVVVLLIDPVIDPGELGVVERLVKLNPHLRHVRAAVRHMNGDFANALADWRAIEANAIASERMPEKRRGLRRPATWGPGTAAVASMTAAMAGDEAQARAWLAQVRAAPAGAAAAIEGRAAIVEAAIDLAAGRAEAAAARVRGAGQLPLDPPAFAVLTRIAAALPPGATLPSAAKLDGDYGRAMRTLQLERLDLRAFVDGLPRYEDPRVIGRYGGAVPFLKANGFRDRL